MEIIRGQSLPGFHAGRFPEEFALIANIANITAAITPVEPQVASIGSKIANIPPDLAFFALFSVQADLTSIEPQSSTIGPDVSRILPDVTTVPSFADTVPARADDRVSQYGHLSRCISGQSECRDDDGSCCHCSDHVSPPANHVGVRARRSRSLNSVDAACCRALTGCGRKSLKRFTNEPIGGPVLERHGADAQIEVDRELIPSQHRPFHSRAIA